MNLNALAQKVGKSVPFVMALQQKHGLPACKDYREGYAVLVQKLIYLSLCSVPLKDSRDLLKSEHRLLELLKVDSLHETPDWFESLCTMDSGPTRLLLSGYDIGYPVSGKIVQPGLDFSAREKELFPEHEMGANALLALTRYAQLLAPIQLQMVRELHGIQDAARWVRKVLPSHQ
jgi:hypothetical protein